MPIVETEVEKPAAQGAAMEITVSRQDLVKELTATQSVVERKTTIPILSNFLIEAEGDRLNITATDLDQAIRTSTKVKVKKPGACTIPARKLYDYIKLLPDGDISIKLLENHWVQIRSGRSNTKMVGMARANYPQVPEFPSVAATSISAGRAEDAYRAHHLRHLKRRVALHAERRTAGDQSGVAGHGGYRRPPALVCRKAQRDS